MANNQEIKSIQVIAEIANSHQGDPDEAIKLIQQLVQTGVDSLKFQIYFADELLTTTHPRYDHFKRQSFSKEQWKKILTEAKKTGKEVYADIFGLEAFEVAVSNNIDGYKLHSSDLNNTQLLNKLAKQNKKVFLATGGSTVLEIQYAIDALLKESNKIEIILLHGFQDYPTKVEDSVLSRLKVLNKLFGDRVSIGYSDHVNGDDKFATITPLMSVAYGVKYIEKHVTMNRSAKGIDYYSSYEPNEIREFVDDLKLAQASIGFNALNFSNSEQHYRSTIKKSWVATKKIKKGQVITDKDLVMKRTPDFSAPPLYERIIGKSVSQDIQMEESISATHLDHKVLAIIVARSNSSRLPNKATLKINEEATITHLFERVMIAKSKGYVDTIAFCTTTLDSDDSLVELAEKYSIEIYRGAVDDVLSRMILAIDDNNDHDIVLRITGDDILIDSEYLQKTVQCHLKNNAHYTDAKALPSGVEVEVFDSSILKLINEFSKDSNGSEYLTNYIQNNKDQFEIASLNVPAKHEKNYRLTLDTKEDYEVIAKLLKHLKFIGKQFNYNMDDIVDYFDDNPEVLKLNSKVSQRATPIEVDTEIDWNYLTRAPLVSVYITNYNYGIYLQESINSVLNQKFKDFELIIIDDGSIDNSREVMNKYVNHPKVTLVFQENKGLNVTNNIAIKLAKGQYMMRLDADDYLNENALLLLSDKLNQNSKLALVFPDYYLVDKNGNILSEEKRHDFTKVTMFDQPAHGACTMIRKDVLEELGGYSNEFTRQDGYELWIKVFKHKKVQNIDLPLFYYRQHGENLTTNKEKLYETRHEIIKKHTQELYIHDKKHIIIIPIRDNENNTIALKDFADSTMLDISLQSLLTSSYIDKIIISTPNDLIIKYIQNRYIDNKIIIDKRPDNLARVNTKIEDTVTYIVGKYDLIDCDTLSIINYEYPLRKSFYINNAINAMYLFEADGVMSVEKEDANFYQHYGDGLKSLKSNNDLRLERDFIYKEVGGIHSVKMKAFHDEGTIVPKKMTHIVLDELSSKEIKTQNDFEYLEYVYKKENGL